ncbi:fimbrillin family protein [Bacteroides gallinarum]|uniref:fimbrillin family protein n=1 Tax=Bacteroides gallinarum TaxID=376806 RepID=UPI0004684189|nr:fimbrillin family protein [Bacteroides gallinarum]
MNIMRNAFKKVNNVLWLIMALLITSCINKVSDEIKESNIPISFSVKTGKTATKATKNTFDTGDRTGIFAMLTGNSLDKQRYIDNLLLECGEGSTLIPKKEVYYPEGDATLDFISYYPYQAESASKGSSLLDVVVQADQSKATGYSLSNFMTARIENVPNSEKTVKLEYKHQFAKIKLVLMPKEGEDADDMLKANPRIIATGFKTQVAYDLQSDKLSAIDDASEKDIVPFGTWKKKGNTLSGKEFIVIPQTHSDSGQAFTLEWNGKIYTCSLPSAVIKEDTELEICINALQSTSETLTGVIASIKEWGFNEQGESENKYDITAIHTASLSFRTSDIYRIYYRGRPVAEVCREYLYATSTDAVDSKAIVAYPVQDNEQTDLMNGIVLQLPDKTAMIHGGKVSWNESENLLTYIAGHSQPIEKFYIDANKKIVTEKPTETTLAINVSSHVIRDIRNGTLQTYPIVKIGTQYWMKEDLQVTHYNDSRSMPLIQTLGGGEGYFKRDDCDAYFYNGEVVLTGRLAPLDWKLPTENDWNRLKEYIGENASVLKKAGAWSPDVNSATNETGFSIQPKGLLLERGNKTTLINANSSTAYWVHDGTQKQLDKVVMFTNSNNDIALKNAVKPEGKDYYNAFSIRCIKE